jgi:hypothetical protein
MCRWVLAAIPVLPFTEAEFLDAMASNKVSLDVQLAETDIVAQYVIKHMVELIEAEGSATELLDQINHNLTLDERRATEWPSNASYFGGRLARAEAALNAAGLRVERKKSGGRRVIRIVNEVREAEVSI